MIWYDLSVNTVSDREAHSHRGTPPVTSVPPKGGRTGMFNRLGQLVHLLLTACSGFVGGIVLRYSKAFGM